MKRSGVWTQSRLLPRRLKKNNTFTFQNKTENIFGREILFILEDLRSQLSQFFFRLVATFDQSGGELPLCLLNLHISDTTFRGLKVFCGELSVVASHTANTAVRSHSEPVLAFPVGFDLDHLIFSLGNMVGLEGKFLPSDDIEVAS